MAEGGEGYLSRSTYQYEYCLKENECTVLYLEGRESGSDSMFEVTMKNETIRGKFTDVATTKRLFFFQSENCTSSIPNPFSGAAWMEVSFAIQLIFGTFVGAMMFL